MRDALDERCCGDKKPVLGICVGMQMLAAPQRRGQARRASAGSTGAVKRFDVASPGARSLPHMGWNDVEPARDDGLFARARDRRALLLPAFVLLSMPRATSDVLAATDYGGEFARAVQRGNVYGVQFHPEKSHQWGIAAAEELRRALRDAAAANHSLPAGAQRRAREDRPIRRARNTSATRSTRSRSSTRRRSTSSIVLDIDATCAAGSPTTS